MANPDKEDMRVTKTRQKVLDIGARILFTDGWDAVTHLQLAAETGVARGTLYRHWPTIDDLIVDIFVNCDPTPYAAPRVGVTRTDLIAELELLSTNLCQSKLGDIILNAARLSGQNEKARLIHEALHEIMMRPLIVILSTTKHSSKASDVGAYLVGPVLYMHLFASPITPPIPQIVDQYLKNVPHQQ